METLLCRVVEKKIKLSAGDTVKGFVELIDKDPEAYAHLEISLGRRKERLVWGEHRVGVCL